ncbi:uncharacterized protein LOC144745738 [Ciona intestinalis]
MRSCRRCIRDCDDDDDDVSVGFVGIEFGMFRMWPFGLLGMEGNDTEHGVSGMFPELGGNSMGGLMPVGSFQAFPLSGSLTSMFGPINMDEDSDDDEDDDDSTTNMYTGFSGGQGQSPFRGPPGGMRPIGGRVTPMLGGGMRPMGGGPTSGRGGFGSGRLGGKTLFHC